MIVEYHRPETMDAALALLARNEPVSVPLGGGTVLSRRVKAEFAVVDLQNLNLDTIEREGDLLHIGATTTLQELVHAPDVPSALAQAAALEASFNLRQAATIGGTIASRDGKSPLLVALLAMDASLKWLPGERMVGLGDWLPLRSDWKRGLIVQVQVPLQAELRYEQVGRTPADQPIISVAVARWPSGRVRIAFGGDTPLPALVADGITGSGIDQISNNAYSHYRDPKYSKTYILETTKALIHRLLD
jgi:putative selenate reductase FAD-binding subunit